MPTQKSIDIIACEMPNVEVLHDNPPLAHHVPLIKQRSVEEQRLAISKRSLKSPPQQQTEIVRVALKKPSASVVGQSRSVVVSPDEGIVGAQG